MINKNTSLVNKFAIIILRTRCFQKTRLTICCLLLQLIKRIQTLLPDAGDKCYIYGNALPKK